MIFKKHNTAVTAALSILSFVIAWSPQASTAEETRSAEWYLEQARPHLHHSCQSAWDAVEQDQDKFIDMIGVISAVSFYNHDFDIARLEALPEDRQEGLQREFYEEIGELCKQNNQHLLAGAVDYSLTNAIAKIMAEEQ